MDENGQLDSNTVVTTNVCEPSTAAQHVVTFNTKLIAHLEQAEIALLTGNIEEADRIIKIANDLGRTENVLKIIARDEVSSQATDELKMFRRQSVGSTIAVGSMNSVMMEAKIIAEAAKMAAYEAKLIVDEAKATVDASKVITENAKVAMDEVKLIADIAKMTTNEAQAITDGAEVASHEAQKVINEARVIADEAKAAVQDARTAADETKVISDEAKLVVENVKALLQGATIISTEAKAAVEDARTATDNIKVIADEAKLALEDAKVMLHQAEIQWKEGKDAAEDSKVILKAAKMVIEETQETSDEVKAAMCEAKVIADGAKTAVGQTKEIVDKAKMITEAAQMAVEETKATVVKIKSLTDEAMLTTDKAKKLVDVIEEAVEDAKTTTDVAKVTSDEAKVTLEDANYLMKAIVEIFSEGMKEGKKAHETKAANDKEQGGSDGKAAKNSQPRMKETSETTKNEQNPPINSSIYKDPKILNQEKSVVDFLIKKAQKAFKNENFQQAHEYILRAQNYDPNANVKDMLADVEVILSFKKAAVDNHIKMADEALKNQNYEEAENNLQEALKIDPDADLNVKLVSVRRKFRKQNKFNAKMYVEKAKQAELEDDYLEARKYLFKARETDPTIQIDDLIDSNSDHIKDRRDTADSLLRFINAAIQSKDYKEAESLIIKLNALKLDIDMQKKLEYVQGLISENAQVETDPVILQRRQKYIDYAKSTVGYINYIEKVPFYKRTKDHPSTPNKYLKQSTYKWDRLMKSWRRQLQFYDSA